MPSPQDIYDYAISQGATPQRAIMLSSAAGAESSWNPTAVHDNHTGYGLFGHRADRLAGMQAFAGSERPDWRSQVSFALHELDKSGIGRMADAAKSPAQLTVAQMHFERPRGYSSDAPQNGDNWSGRLNLTSKIMDAVNGAKDWAAVGKSAVADAASDFGSRVGSDMSALQAQQAKYLDAMKALLSQGYQAPEHRPGLLGQLLFGDKGLSGLIHEHMPNGILGGLSGQLHASLPNGLLGGLFGLGSAHAAPVSQPASDPVPADVPTPPQRPLIMAGDVPTPPTRPEIFGTNLPPLHIGDGGAVHNDANQALLDQRAAQFAQPLPDWKPQQLGGLDALQSLFSGGMLG